MSKPSFLFVPGSYCLPSLYQSIFDGVSQAGYDINGIHLPSVGLSSGNGRDGPGPSMYEDADAIAREAERLADKGIDLIIVGHSYAGVPMSQAPKGLSKNERQAQGRPGGVVHLGYMTALIPPIGQSAADVLSVLPESKRFPMDLDVSISLQSKSCFSSHRGSSSDTISQENGWMYPTDPAMVAQRCMQDLPPAEGEAVVKRFAKHSARSFGDKLTHAAYADIPVSYLITENDLAGPPEIIQRPQIDMINRLNSRKVHVTSVYAGHMMNLSAEKETVDWIVSLARKVEQGQEAA